MYEQEHIDAIDSRLEGLAAELEYAKKHIFEVKLDFETRYRVWKDQVLPDRLRQLEKHLSLETAVRFFDLTVADAQRLYRRAAKEFMVVADDTEITAEKLKFFQQLFLERQNLIYNGHSGFVNDLRDIVEKHNEVNRT